MFVPVLIVVAVVIAASAAGLNAYVQRRRHRRRMAVCPGCGLPADEFEVADDSVVSMEQHQDDLVVCRNIISESPFAECSFTLPRWSLDVPWLRFAGVGGTCSAGQTIWNAACSSRLRPFLINEKVSVESLPFADQHDFQRIWDGIEYGKCFPCATLTSSRPIPWCVAVRTRARRATLRIVAVSDFAGEIPRGTLEDRSYRDLLDKDGHLFFLDLTQVKRIQLEVFHRFLVNLRATRGLRNAETRLSPIAVCIGKLDLLPECQNGSENIARAIRCIQEIRDSGPADEATTLTAIRRRHELILKHSELFGCVKSLNGRLQDECGKDGFMFFPMASVGWVGRDLSAAATIAPYAVVDPLLWLMHVSGMKILPP